MKWTEAERTDKDASKADERLGVRVEGRSVSQTSGVHAAVKSHYKARVGEQHRQKQHIAAEQVLQGRF